MFTRRSNTANRNQLVGLLIGYLRLDTANLPRIFYESIRSDDVRG